MIESPSYNQFPAGLVCIPPSYWRGARGEAAILNFSIWN